MTAHRPAYRITAGPGPARTARTRYGIRHGLAAVAILLLTAADELASALTGWPPIAHVWRTIAAPVRAAYRRAAWPPPELAAARIVPPAPEREDT